MKFSDSELLDLHVICSSLDPGSNLSNSMIKAVEILTQQKNTLILTKMNVLHLYHKAVEDGMEIFKGWDRKPDYDGGYMENIVDPYLKGWVRIATRCDTIIMLKESALLIELEKLDHTAIVKRYAEYAETDRSEYMDYFWDFIEPIITGVNTKTKDDIIYINAADWMLDNTKGMEFWNKINT